MPNSTNQPNAYDLVYGDQSAVPASGVVLGGLAGVRQQLTADSQTVRMAALHKALDYGDAGLDLIIEVLDYQGLSQAAYDILLKRPEAKARYAVSLGVPHQYESVTVNPKGKIIQRQARQARLRRENLGNGVTLDIVLIPGGTFLMGSPEDELDRRESEGPQHQVSLEPFFMGRYPITQAQWRAVTSLPQVERKLDPDPSYFKGDNRPVERVSWHEAMEFCDRLSKKLGQPYTLPSEAQWEYACRAGTSTTFHFGETITTDLANYNGNYTYGLGPKGTYRRELTEVDSFPPNAFGLYDMHGNVWEWCLDQYHENYRGAPTDGSAWMAGSYSSRPIRRGGSWFDDPRNCRCASRYTNNPTFRLDLNGFRVVSVPPRAPL